jgi:hypothetical protein
MPTQFKVMATLGMVLTAAWLTGCAPNGLPTAPTGTQTLPPAGTQPAPSTTAPTATPTPTPTGTLACERDRPAGNPTIGTSRQGEYLGQQLPQGYHVYGSEAEVTAAIQRVYDNGGDWACFQRFYPGASTVFKRRGRL